jgi:hypothetical protein
MGFIFGMSGMTFGLMGFISGINASHAITSASARIERLEKRLEGAGIADNEDETD